MSRDARAPGGAAAGERGAARSGPTVLCLLLAAAMLQPGEREVACAELSIVDLEDGARLGEWPLRPGETVTYAYTHTAEGLPAEELMELGPGGELYPVASRSPQHGAGHVPRAPLRASTERPGWETARLAGAAALTPFAMFTDEPELGDPRLLWRGRDVALARLRPRRHVEWRVERRCR